MSIEVTADAAPCEKVYLPTHTGRWSCMLDAGHAAESCVVVPSRDDRRAEVLQGRELVALRAEVERLRATSTT